MRIGSVDKDTFALGLASCLSILFAGEALCFLGFEDVLDDMKLLVVLSMLG